MSTLDSKGEAHFVLLPPAWLCTGWAESDSMTLPHPHARLCASVDEAAQLLGVSASTVYRRVDLPTRRIGSRVVIPYGALASQLGCSVPDVATALAAGWSEHEN